MMKSRVDKKTQRKVNALCGLILLVGILFLVVDHYYPMNWEVYVTGCFSLIAVAFFCYYQILFKVATSPVQNKQEEVLLPKVSVAPKRTLMPEMNKIPQSSRAPQTSRRQTVIAQHVSLQQNNTTPRKIRGLPPPTILEKRLYKPHVPFESDDD